MTTSEDHAVNLHKLTLFSKNVIICIDLCSKMIELHKTVPLALASLAADKRTIFVHINRFNIGFLLQLNVTWQGISIPPQSCYLVSLMAAHFVRNQSTTSEKIPCYSGVFV